MNEIIINKEFKAISSLEKIHLFDDLMYQELSKLWYKSIIRPEKLDEANKIAKQLLANKPIYDNVFKATGVPWFVIGCIHHMESDCNFKTHLHNGDSLMARTVQVPAGRPKEGKPPFSWNESAVDALGYDHFVGVKDWTIFRVLFMLEAYNGFGYRDHNCLSCYVWAGTSVQTKGRYVADGEFDANAWSERVGCVAIIESLINMKAIDYVSDDINAPSNNPDNNAQDRKITHWVLNSRDFRDCRGYDANNKVVCWLDSENSIEKLYYNIMLAGGSELPLKFSGNLSAKPENTPNPFPPVSLPKTNPEKFVAYYRDNYMKVRQLVESWFTPQYSPTAVKNGCAAHCRSALCLAGFANPDPKTETNAAINADKFYAWLSNNGYKKITNSAQLEPGDICFSGTVGDLTHVFVFNKYLGKGSAEILDNQQIGLHPRSLTGVGCGVFVSAMRMAK